MKKKLFWQLFANVPKYCLKDKVWKNLKKIFNPKLCVNPHQSFNFKNEFLGSKNSKIVVFIVKILQVRELLPKIECEKWKNGCARL